MAEIIVNMAAARWAASDDKRPAIQIGRSPRAISGSCCPRLSTGCCETDGPTAAGGSGQTKRPNHGPFSIVRLQVNHRAHQRGTRRQSLPALGRIATAKSDLNTLLRAYVDDYREYIREQRHLTGRWHARLAGQRGSARLVWLHPYPARRPSPGSAHAGGGRGSPRRAGANPDGAHRATTRAASGGRSVAGPGPAASGTRHRSADADQPMRTGKFRSNLRDGVSLDMSGRRPPASMVIEVDPPPPLKDLADLMVCLVEPGQEELPAGDRQFLSDLGRGESRSS